MKFRTYFVAIVLALILGVGFVSAVAQDDEGEEEIVVETMTVHANSPAEKLFTVLKNSYSDYILKNKKDRRFDITVESLAEDKVIENFTTQKVSNVALCRILTKSEIEKFVETNNKAPKVVPIFRMPIIVLVHKTNSINEFDLETLKKIFTGEIKSWKELDKESVDDKIELLVPPSNTDAYRLFKEVILDGEDYFKDNLVQKNEGTIADHIKFSGARIGFMSRCYFGDNPRVQQARLVNENGQTYMMKVSDIKKETYPLVLKIYFHYTEELPKAFDIMLEYAKKNPVGLLSIRLHKFVSIN
ncbi:MAG: substrate-binding domain-containing protein [Planctomycetes bacterium]|nr:substrate-binding domain-containing protein [Planctomycetota bacterium]